MAEGTELQRRSVRPFTRRSTRWIDSGEASAGRLAARRLADELRLVTALLLETTAPAALLEELAAEAARLRERLAAANGNRMPRNEVKEPGEQAERSFRDTSPLIGLTNPVAPPLTLSLDGETVRGVCVFGQAYEGPPGHVHGGFIAAAFDEVLGATQAFAERPGMTGRLVVRYRRPVPLRREVVFSGRLLRVEGRKILTEATLTVDGVLHAEAEGLFVSVDPSRLRGGRAG